jgi:hypothetical protein
VTPVGRPSAALFESASSKAAAAPPGSSPGPVAGKTAGPATPRAEPSPAEKAGGQGASGTGRARDDQERSTTEQSGAEQGGAGRNGPAGTPDSNAVVIVPGIARYHRTGCILIRFLGSDDLETSTVPAAEAKGCTPCRACEPDKPLSSGA